MANILLVPCPSLDRTSNVTVNNVTVNNVTVNNVTVNNVTANNVTVNNDTVNNVTVNNVKVNNVTVSLQKSVARGHSTPLQDTFKCRHQTINAEMQHIILLKRRSVECFDYCQKESFSVLH